MSAVLVPTSLDDSRVLALLDIWERWMRESAGSAMELGYALQCRQFQANPGAYWEHTFADSVEAAEYGHAAAINAAIDALEAPLQMAVYSKHGCAVYRWNRANVDDLYGIARQVLARTLYIRGLR